MIDKLRTILRFAKPVYKRIKPIFDKIRDLRSNSKPNELVFVFQGMSQDWGIPLYQNDLDFRKSIKHCNDILIKLGGHEILSHFEQTADKEFYETPLTLTRYCAVQVAMVELLSAKEIFPNAVFGTSSGFYASCYAAGVVNLKEALTLALGIGKIAEMHKQNYSVLFIALSLNTLRDFAKECPYWLEVVYEDGPGAVMCYCLLEDIGRLGQYLNQNQIKWRDTHAKNAPPFHTSHVRQYKNEFIALVEKIVFKPLKCDFYFDYSTQVTPKGAVFDSDTCFEILCSPALFSDALQVIIDSGYRTFLQIGLAPISERRLSNLKKPVKVNLINTVVAGQPELKDLTNIFSDLAKFRFRIQKEFYLNDAEIFNHFLNNFDLFKINPLTSFEYLRTKGPVHYLPVNKNWIILDYNNVEYILKNPDTFSSVFYRDYDEYLLAAEPANHKISREVLHPLFSPQIVDELTGFAKDQADRLFDDLLSEEHFDLLKNFSKPLIESVIFNFFGFSPEHSAVMVAVVGNDQHAPDYFNKLGDFLGNYLLQEKIGIAPGGAIDKIRQLMNAGTLSFDEARSVARLFWLAGTVTTSTLICSALRYLLENNILVSMPDDKEKFTAKFINECIRLAPSVNYTTRTANTIVKIAELQIPAKSKLILSFESANCDPEHFKSPNKFDLNRPTKRNFSFGTHIHSCIGIGIARAILGAVIKSAIERSERFSNYQLGKSSFIQGSDVKFITSMPVSNRKSRV